MSFVAVVVLFCVFKSITGHGMMLDPPNRSSLWRYMAGVPQNFDDNQNFCGGARVQWGLFNGQCGVCGDVYNEAHPQPNENTGYYGRGVVTRHYESGSVINILVNLTSNHLGDFRYSLCVLDDPDKPESGEECFKDLILADGSLKYNVSSTDYEIVNQVKLPDGLRCERCVLRWHYTAGNNWGYCPDGSGALGCGPQENFRSCADIAIY